MGMEIFLYIPNIIGYVRLVLVAISWWTFYSNPLISFTFYVMSACLDFVDGWTARKFNQVSAFGAWFDIVIDLLSRGILWCRMYSFGYLIIALEWCCFVCTHTLGSSWKTSFVKEPWFVRAVMANNFRTVMGAVAIAGLHVLPLWLYSHQYGILDHLGMAPLMQYIGIVALSIGRVTCASVEIWCVWSHISYLVSDEANRTYNKASTINTES